MLICHTIYSAETQSWLEQQQQTLFRDIRLLFVIQTAYIIFLFLDSCCV